MISSKLLTEAVPDLRVLPYRATTRLADAATERRFAKNAVLYRAGDAPDGLFFILAGRVRVMRPVGEKVRLLHTEKAGGILGEIPVFGGGPFPGTAVAVQATRCAHLSLQALQRLMRDEPDFAAFALKRLATRARALIARIDELTTTTMTARVARYILNMPAAGTPQFSLGISQQELAQDFGTAREVIVRALAALVDGGALSRSGRSRFTVASTKVLQRMARP